MTDSSANQHSTRFESLCPHRRHTCDLSHFVILLPFHIHLTTSDTPLLAICHPPRFAYTFLTSHK